MIDNKKINGISNRFVSKWQSSFMHVPQNIFLADASIAENIAFGLRKDEIDINKEKITNFIDIPTKNNIEIPSIIIVKPVPKSG